MSQIQIQKQIRLRQARLLIATRSHDVTGVSHRVGYDSPRSSPRVPQAVRRGPEPRRAPPPRGNLHQGARAPLKTGTDLAPPERANGTLGQRRWPKVPFARVTILMW